MLFKAILTVVALAQAVQAHFGIEYPDMRADSFEEPYSQWVWPCAGVNQSEVATNRTDWPLDGGSIVLELHHPWDYIWINLGVGTIVTGFNVSLTPGLFNHTGNGTLCIPKLTIPAGVEIEDGLNASIQVVTTGARGNALYNCADITFRANATVLSGDACNTTASGPLNVLSSDDSLTCNLTAPAKVSGAIRGSSSAVWTATLTVLIALGITSFGIL